MVFSDLVFIFAFLPICVILGVITRKWIKIQNVLLLLASLVFYSWGEPEYILLFVVTILLNWLLVLISKRVNKKFCKIIGIATIVLDLLILFRFKYEGWIGKAFNLSIGSAILPIGISFYTFQAISYVADVSLLNKYKEEGNPINVGLYIAFFPQLVAGPIVRYQDMKNQIHERCMNLSLFENGCFRFILGFCKKVLLADSMAIIVDKAWSSGTELSSAFAWLGAVAYTLQIFMDFSGYSDMAIGLGSMFGFNIPENFNCPYKANTIRDFWKRWHITLSIWFRDYVYIPLGGNKTGKYRTILNIAVVWLLTGIWHGANWTFILWGVSYGVLVILEKSLDIDAKLKNGGALARIVYRLFTLLCIVLLWVLFRSSNIEELIRYFGAMFRFETTGLAQAVLYLTEFKWAMIACIILSSVSTEKMMKCKTVLWPIALLFFIIGVSYLVKGTFSPFLYFNF